MLQSHKATALSNMETIPFCCNHQKEVAKFFCVTDEHCICSTCAFLEHKDESHKCVEINEGLQMIKSQLNSLKFSEDLEEIKESIQKLDKTINSEKLDFEKRKIELEREFTKKVTDLEISKKKLNESFEKLVEFEKDVENETTLLGFLKLKETLITDPYAQKNVAQFYENGGGVEIDLKKAFDLYTLSAEQGNASAQNRLALFYEESHDFEVSDISKAIELYILSSNQGNSWAQCNLGICYLDGDGIQKDLKKAIELFKLSVDQGNDEAQYQLGMLYYDGVDLKKNIKKAMKLFKFSADQGNVKAKKMFILDSNPINE
jgi:TPR repeat protein